MNEPEHILRQQGKVTRSEWCSCDDGFWMRNLVDPHCAYHSDYGEELRDLIGRAADVLNVLKVSSPFIGTEDDTDNLIVELRKATE